jgi:mannose-6-phosphate isomerase
MNYYKFTPLLKTMIWGTENWQISGVAGNETMSQDGQSLNQLVSKERDLLVGRSNYQRFGDEFPLLIKFIDAQRDLSIQVHPTDEVAHRHGKPRGKTEMWYVMDSAPHATLYNGLKMQITPEQYKEHIKDDWWLTAEEALKLGVCDEIAEEFIL